MPQGTVKSFDTAEGTAVVLDDSMRQIHVDQEAFAASGLLELRLGQRVRFELDEDPSGETRLTNLNIVSL